MCSARSRHEESEPPCWLSVSNGDGVELAIHCGRLRRQLKDAAEVLCIGDDHDELSSADAIPTFRLQIHLEARIPEDLAKTRTEVQSGASEPPDRVEVLDHCDIDAESGEIQKVPVLDPPDIHGDIRAVDCKADRLARIVYGRADGFGEVVAGSRCQKSEPHARCVAGIEDRVGDVAPRSVAAEGDEGVESVVERARYDGALVTSGTRRSELPRAGFGEKRLDSGYDARTPPPSGGGIRDDAD